MRRVLLTVALTLAAAAAALAARQVGAEGGRTVLLCTLAAISGAGAALTLWSALHPRGGLLRLDWFLPMQRKQSRRVRPMTETWLHRCARRVLPSAWLTDRQSGRPGAVRRLLKRLGPSVVASPIRRAVQAACLAVFAVLFFYVCWPYSARPAPDAETSRGWAVDRLEPESASATLRGLAPPWAAAGADVHVSRTVAGQQEMLGQFEVAERRTADGGESALVLQAVDELTPRQFDMLVTHDGLWTLHDRDPQRWPSHYADDLAAKEKLPAESFLVIDPLVSLSTAIAARSWVWSLACAAAILLVCVLVPRGFCGYVCPLGTVIDLWDWAVSSRVTRFRVSEDGWWVHLKYYLLAATLVSAVAGVLVAGFVAAIPVVTRGFLFLFDPLQTGVMRDWHQVPPVGGGHWLSIGLFFGVLGLGLLRPRFWCKYVCPSGAVFSLGNLLRVTERKVDSTCIHCNRCVEICPFDAIKPDFTTRTTDCTMCQSCGGVCPTEAIVFIGRWESQDCKAENDPPTGETPIGRRGFLSLAAGAAGAVAGGLGAAAGISASAAAAAADPLVRPPGSVPETEFLQMCIRCGECFKACPNHVLHPEGFQQGLAGLWAPVVDADWAGCESSCNACGQVCPTGAIRALPLEEKKAARMGLAIVDQQTCLPIAGREACQLCVDECAAAGYDAIEFLQVHTQVDDQGRPIEGTGFLAPVVLPEKCVGCGLCQTRCHVINVKDRGVLDDSAIIIEAGEGKEDRLMEGSYLALREEEAARRRQNAPATAPADEPPDKPPDKPPATPPLDADPDPFGVDPF